MANRHKFARGGGTPDVAYGNKDVISEAEERKKGGACRADGGKVVAKKDGGKVPGRKSGGRLDKFARGGRAGSDKSPFSSSKLGDTHG